MITKYSYETHESACNFLHIISHSQKMEGFLSTPLVSYPASAYAVLQGILSGRKGMDMQYTKAELKDLLTIEEFPRSASYDPVWMLENLMGPNAIWLVEALSQVMDLPPGMCMLDLGCGKAASSIFLAREFGLQVWATDLWVNASDNRQRICAANLQQQVFPIHAEAHALPFAHSFFDAL